MIRSISSSPIFAPGRPLYRRPRHSGSLQASYSRDRVSLALGGVFVGSRVDTDFNFPTVSSNEGYATWNASGEVRIARAHSRASSRSTTWPTANTWSRSAIPALGRTVRAGIRTRF